MLRLWGKQLNVPKLDRLDSFFSMPCDLLGTPDARNIMTSSFHTLLLGERAVSGFNPKADGPSEPLPTWYLSPHFPPALVCEGGGLV